MDPCTKIRGHYLGLFFHFRFRLENGPEKHAKKNRKLAATFSALLIHDCALPKEKEPYACVIF